MKDNKFYITTPIYYASGKPHLGHAFTSIAADVIARWNRNIGKQVFFQTGTDEHGQKIVEKAKEMGKDPKQFVDLMVPQFQDLMKRLNISYDYFIRTTNEEHKKIIQKMLQKSFDNGDIYKGTYKGLYCVGCERYYTEDELIDGKICPDHKTEVLEVEEENYFFKLSKYQDKLLKFYQETDFLIPKSRAQETINRVKEGLQDISISRNKNKLEWGIDLPFDDTHVTYVWFDALFNYVSGLEINDKEDFWPADVHMIGKDIKWFHEVYWPAFLMSVGMETPKKVFSHGFILDKDGHKMSKSLGNVIDPIKFAKKYGVDEFRYFLIAGGSFGEDINFDLEVFVSKINNELNNDLGNLVSRVHAMTGKYFDGVVSKISELTEIDKEFIEKLNIFEEFNKLIQNLEFNKAFEVLFTAIRETNAYVNLTAPWKEENKERLGTVMNILCSSVVYFAKYLDCIIPEKAERIFKQYNLGKDSSFKFDFIDGGHKLNSITENLFQNIENLNQKDLSSKDISKINANIKNNLSNLNNLFSNINSINKTLLKQKEIINLTLNEFNKSLDINTNAIQIALRNFKKSFELNNEVFKIIRNNYSHKLGEKDNLFEKIKLEEKKEEVVEKNNFEKLNLKVGQIDEVKKHPESEKLYILQVNLGKEKRQIVSGLQQIYSAKEIQDKKVIVITNLKPAKLGGYDSNGMVLACEDPVKGHDDCGLLTSDLEVGTEISCGEFNANNEAIIKSKIFEKAGLVGKQGKVYFEGKELKGVGIDKGFEGRIC